MSVHGFLWIDKPKGITSHDTVQRVRKILKIRKVGHSGNLDPHATGLLILGVGWGTRFLPYLMDLSKTYLTQIQLGVLTDTLDVTGEVLQRREVPPLTEEQVRGVLRQFLGEIDQVPPAYSAVKVQGKRLYELAREGILVVPKKKRVTVHELELIHLSRDTLTLRARVSKGTYIRSLARDIAEALGTVGVVRELRRLSIGPYTVENAVPLEDEELVRQSLKSFDEGLGHMPEVVLRPAGVGVFLNGNRVSLRAIARRSRDAGSFQYVRVYDAEQQFLGIGFLTWDGLYPKRLLPVTG